MYLWRLHSTAHDGPELYRSTITASTRWMAIPLIRQSLLVVASVIARRSPDIHVGLYLGSDVIWRGRLVGLCVTHAFAFSHGIFSSCTPYTANHGSVSTPLTTAISESHGMPATRAQWSKTIFVTTGHHSDGPRISKNVTFLTYSWVYLIRETNVDFCIARTYTGF